MSTVAQANPGVAASTTAQAPARPLGADATGLVMAGLLALAFIAVFYRWLWKQHQYSLNYPADWGHAYIIPLISGYLIWQHREALARVRPEVFWPGLAPLLTGIGAYFFFLATPMANHTLQGFSIILALFGLVLLTLGPVAMRYLFLPICYLVFAVGISPQFMEKLTFPLQLMAAQGSYVMLAVLGAAAGFTTELNGNTITVTPQGGAPMPLNVAEACSGMRMVIAFFALGAAVALTGCRHWWQRAALLLLAAPIAIFLNMIRVVVLALASFVDSELAAGQAHTFIGTLLLVPGLLLFMLVVWILNKVVNDEAPPAGAGGAA